MHQRVDFQHFYVQSYPDSRSCHRAGDLIGGFSTLLLVVACNYCYGPPSSFKLPLSFSLSFSQLTAISGQKVCIEVADHIPYLKRDLLSTRQSASFFIEKLRQNARTFFYSASSLC